MKRLKTQRDYEAACWRQVDIEEQADRENRPLTPRERRELDALMQAILAYEEGVMASAMDDEPSGGPR